MHYKQPLIFKSFTYVYLYHPLVKSFSEFMLEYYVRRVHN